MRDTYLRKRENVHFQHSTCTVITSGIMIRMIRPNTCHGHGTDVGVSMMYKSGKCKSGSGITSFSAILLLSLSLHNIAYYQHSVTHTTHSSLTASWWRHPGTGPNQKEPRATHHSSIFCILLQGFIKLHLCLSICLLYVLRRLTSHRHDYSRTLHTWSSCGAAYRQMPHSRTLSLFVVKAAVSLA